jgi:outer membrane protein OmpA-like peptidoglycan-associated protein
MFVIFVRFVFQYTMKRSRMFRPASYPSGVAATLVASLHIGNFSLTALAHPCPHLLGDGIMKIRNVLLGAAASLLVAGTASADYTSPTGWYLSLGAGANWIEDGDFNRYGPNSVSGEFDFDDGYIAAGALGYDFGRNWRVEFEVAYRDNDIDGSAGREVWELSQLFNVLYDFPLGGNWEASVGAGIGGNLIVLQGQDSIDLDDYVFAGQLIAEASYRLSDRWQAFANYHYLIMDDFNSTYATNPLLGIEFEKTEHALLVGLRFDLQRDGAAPERPRQPDAAAPKQFIVFFGFNKSNLTAEAARVVTEAAAAAKKYGSASISVVGHTDTVGSNDYNMRLSMRRSQAVKDGLMANGIAADMITTGGRGEAELMVQTGDSVKEPQNRRATIDLK